MSTGFGPDLADTHQPVEFKAVYGQFAAPTVLPAPVSRNLWLPFPSDRAYKASPRNPAGVWGTGASVVPEPTVNRVTFTRVGFDPNQAATQS